MKSFNLIPNLSNDCKEIPINGCPSNFYTIEFKGCRSFIIDANDSSFSLLLELAHKTLNIFFDTYKHTFAFSQPTFVIMNGNSFAIKIGTLEIEAYKRIYEKDEA